MKGETKLKVAALRRASMKRQAGERLSSMSDNEVAKQMRKAKDAFLQSAAWKALRLTVIARYGAKCMRCGHTPRQPLKINVDHVKPRKFYPELALEESNLQVLCASCNKAKGNKVIDYREAA